MSQHDNVIANDSGPNVRADINNALQAQATLNSGASAPSTTYANMWWIDTTTNTLKRRNNANTAWKIIASLDSANIEAKSSGFTIGDDDIKKYFPCTGTFTVAFDAVATLTSAFSCLVKNVGTGTITLDPASTEQIDGATTKALGPGDWCIIFCDGSAIYTMGSDDILSVSNSWARPQRLADTAVSIISNEITIDVSTQPSSTVDVDANITTVTLNNISSLTDGDIVKIWFIQDGTGGYTVTGWPASMDWGEAGAAPDISVGANEATRMVFECKTINSTKALRFLGANKGFTD